MRSWHPQSVLSMTRTWSQDLSIFNFSICYPFSYSTIISSHYDQPEPLCWSPFFYLAARIGHFPYNESIDVGIQLIVFIDQSLPGWITERKGKHWSGGFVKAVSCPCGKSFSLTAIQIQAWVRRCACQTYPWDSDQWQCHYNTIYMYIYYACHNVLIGYYKLYHTGRRCA